MWHWQRITPRVWSAERGATVVQIVRHARYWRPFAWRTLTPAAEKAIDGWHLKFKHPRHARQEAVRMAERLSPRMSP